MKEIKDIIASNLIALRKSKNLTQQELAEKLSYSDNMVSRWERAEILPSIDTLENIANFYNVPLTHLLEENVLEASKEKHHTENVRKFTSILVMLSIAWFFIIGVFVYANIALGKLPWQIFVLGVPISCAFLLSFHEGRKNHVYRFVILSVFLWSALAFFYIQFLDWNSFLVFLLGIPLQLGLVLWTFIRPKTK